MVEQPRTSQPGKLLVSCQVDEVTEHVGPAMPMTSTNVGLIARKPILVSEVDDVSVFIGNSVPPQEIYAPPEALPGQPAPGPNLVES
jgi:hypothetical protein